MRWVHLGAPVFKPQMQVQSHLEPASYMRFGFGPLAAPHPEPGVRCGFGAGSGGSKTGLRPVYEALFIYLSLITQLTSFTRRAFYFYFIISLAISSYKCVLK